jgi:hypothetical protein
MRMQRPIRFNVRGFVDRRTKALLGAAAALEQKRADQALEQEFKKRVERNEAARVTGWPYGRSKR